MKKLIKIMLSIALFIGVANASEDLNIIPLKKAKGMFNAKSALFLDARGFKLYQKGTIMAAVHMPTKKYKNFKKWLPIDKHAKIVTFCNGIKCEESDKLARKLMADGYNRVYVYKGGYPEWKKEKLPLMSLVKECKEEKKGPYKPKNPLITINGAKVHLGGESAADGMIDQFWFAQLVNEGKIPANIQLVDVRKPSQFKEGSLPGAINVPFQSKPKESIDYTKFPKNKLIVFYCNTGMQSTDARNILEDDVAKNVLIFDANVVCEKGKKCVVTANEDL